MGQLLDLAFLVDPLLWTQLIDIEDTTLLQEDKNYQVIKEQPYSSWNGEKQHVIPKD
jgi:hypothetical protein